MKSVRLLGLAQKAVEVLYLVDHHLPYNLFKLRLVSRVHP